MDLVNASSGQVWPLVAIFSSNQIPVVVSNGNQGVIETDWLKILGLTRLNRAFHRLTLFSLIPIAHQVLTYINQGSKVRESVIVFLSSQSAKSDHRN